MVLKNLKQPSFNTSLLGVLRAAADYYGIDISTPMLYGASGHAFLMNVHRELCPSGPYVWNPEPFYLLTKNLGLNVADLGFFHSGSAEEEAAHKAGELSKRYEVIAAALARTSDRDMPAAEKIALLETARDNETEAISSIEALVAAVV
jgi:hypothetical protein